MAAVIKKASRKATKVMHSPNIFKQTSTVAKIYIIEGCQKHARLYLLTSLTFCSTPPAFVGEEVFWLSHCNTYEEKFQLVC